MDGIRKSWEKGLPVSISQLSIILGDDSTELFDLLKRLESRPLIRAEQVTERIERLRNNNAQKQLDKLLDDSKSSEKPLHEIANNIRVGLDKIQSKSELILPQSRHLSRIMTNLKSADGKILKSGIISLDRLLGGGFREGKVIMMTGAAGTGKTAFALQAADSVAENGALVVYVSMEMENEELTQRSLKRLNYTLTGKPILNNDYDRATAEYQKLADNIFIQKGHYGMQVSEIRGMILSIMGQRQRSDILLVIDPFQRLGTGDERNDKDETAKVNKLCAEIKEMAGSLKIPILALSDTVKSHANSTDGSGTIRGSYMGDHISDCVITMRSSRDAIKALYNTKQNTEINPDDHPFYKDVEKALSGEVFVNGLYTLTEKHQIYVALAASKVRDSAKFSPLLIYNKAYNHFTDTLLWEDILEGE